MKARKGRTQRPTRLQVSWTLVKAEPRVAILFWFFILGALAILSFEFMVWFQVASRTSWPVVTKLLGLIRWTVTADALVLFLTLWGVRHFSIFSWMDRVLTHVPVAVAGAIFIAYASYRAFTTAAPLHRPITMGEAAAMFFGSFLFFWVFLFGGRKRSATSN